MVLHCLRFRVLGFSGNWVMVVVAVKVLAGMRGRERAILCGLLLK